MAWMAKFFKLRFSYVKKPNLFSLQSFYGKWNVFSVYFNFLSNTPIFFVAKKQHFSKQQAFFQVFCHNSIFTGALEPIIIKIYLWGLQLLKENTFCKPGSNFEMSLCCKLKKKKKFLETTFSLILVKNQCKTALVYANMKFWKNVKFKYFCF